MYKGTREGEGRVGPPLVKFTCVDGYNGKILAHFKLGKIDEIHFA